MKSYLLCLPLSLFSWLTLDAQSGKGMYFGVGLTTSYFQDLEYSAITHELGGLSLRTGYHNYQATHIWDLGLEVKGHAGAAFSEGWFQYSVSPTVHFRYLRNVRPRTDASLYVGARLDLLDGLVFINDALSNNAGYYFTSSNLSLSGIWTKPLNENWNLDVSLSAAVLGFTKELTGFSFSIPQEMLERGEFHYQRVDDVSPFNLKYYQTHTIGKYNRIRARIGFTKENRHGFSYEWEFSHVAQSKGNPLTFGNHNLKWTIFFGKKKSKKETPKL